MNKSLVTHVPIKISEQAIPIFRSLLINMGYSWTFFQVVKPKQLFGVVKQIELNGKKIDHHVRCFVDGSITTEIELRRVEDMWRHLTTRSISAHERVIKILEENVIQYNVDHDLREHYNQNGPTEFVKDYLEFFRWLFIGVIIMSPLGYIWQLFYFGFKSKKISNTDLTEKESSLGD